jgi:hypothetical protein
MRDLVEYPLRSAFSRPDGTDGLGDAGVSLAPAGTRGRTEAIVPTPLKLSGLALIFVMAALAAWTLGAAGRAAEAASLETTPAAETTTTATDTTPEETQTTTTTRILPVPVSTESSSSSSDGTSTWVWVLVAILGVGLIVLIVLLVRRGKR